MITKIIEFVKDKVQGKVPLLSKRSPHWPTIRAHWLKFNGQCAACGATSKLQVHHVKPFHIDPKLELDYNNFITLCEEKGGYECHLHIGHRGNFKNEVPTVREDAAAMRSKLGLKPLAVIIPKEGKNA